MLDDLNDEREERLQQFFDNLAETVSNLTGAEDEDELKKSKGDCFIWGSLSTLRTRTTNGAVGQSGLMMAKVSRRI
jgi:hypothetical protein